jgi:preprotein translocase subunit SecA
LLEYDEVMDEQRKRVYGYRQQILDGTSCRKLILDQLFGQIERMAGTFLEADYGAASFAAWASGQLACQLDARDFRGTDFNTAVEYSRDQATRASENLIYEAIEENLPSDGDEEEWNWQAMATWSNKRYGTNYRDRDLKTIGRDQLSDELIEKAHAKVASLDLSEGQVFLESDFGLRSLCGWMRHKFGIEVVIDELRNRERDDVVKMLFKRASEGYNVKELEYPALTGISAFTFVQGSQVHLDREGLARWVNSRFDVEIPAEELRTTRDELKSQLVEYSSGSSQYALEAKQRVKEKIATIFKEPQNGTADTPAVAQNGALTDLSDWLKRELGVNVSRSLLKKMDRQQVEQVVDGAVDDHFHPEMRRMERQVLLSIVDSAWKDHLLAMDHLRSSVGLKGYAQLDPKVEYKREGMRLFEQMWDSIGERTTDLIFRMESFNEDFVRSTWVDARTRHDDVSSPAVPPPRAAGGRGAVPAGQQTNESNSEPVRREPVRKTGPRVGRNDPCPCGSGKKFKNCCMGNLSEG